MKQKLDKDQTKAVKHSEGPALVVAGPGSGKTTVIKERILHLIRKHNVDPENILAIAFTNAAADEMRDRLRKSGLSKNAVKICTLHVFGKDLITENYEEAGFAQEPNNIWDDKEIGKIIEAEKDLLDQKTRSADVFIYKVKDKTTHQCYIGQTIDPKRRRQEHFSDSSNRLLCEAIQRKGKEAFDFKVIEENVKGAIADAREEFYIDSHRNRSVVNLVYGLEQVARKSNNVFVAIYKIQSMADATAYIGYTTDPESIRKTIENNGVERFTFEIIRTEVPWAEASIHVANEIKKHKNWAVFNRQDPQKARYSNQLRIEMFCQHFNVPYDEVLESPKKFENLMDKFNRLKEDIEREKRQVTTGVFEPVKISDPILRAFAKRYEERKEEAQALDFLDMLIYSANMIENNSDLRRKYQEKYRYVFVDEFQDISPIDFRLIDLFPENLFAVGDDDQAIYGFRGGDSLIMQEKFGKRENVTHYKITRNYRSTSTVVRHARALIEHNPLRIPKNLRANNSALSPVKVLRTPRGTTSVKKVLSRELSSLLTTDFKKVGVLARNWRGEINEIQRILDFSELRTQGFEIRWEELGDSDGKNRTKIILQRGTKRIEILNIHTAKGKEWDKVIFLVNTIYKSFPDKRNDSTEERRLFYVAVTRAKQELVVLDGGDCQFVSEFQKAPLTMEDIEHAFREELAAQEPEMKKKLEEGSKAALARFQYRLKKELGEVSNAARKQNETTLSRLRSNVTQTENAITQLGTKLQRDLEVANENLIEGLIPVLDEFEALFENVPETIKVAADCETPAESIQRAQRALLDSLKSHGLKPIEVSPGENFNPVYHEEISSAIYSDEVPAGQVAREKQRGYLLHNRVVRKAQVVISKKKQRADGLLSRGFTQPVRFVTYAGFRDLRNIEAFEDGVKGVNLQGKEIELQKRNVLFVFAKKDMEALKSRIKMRRVIANRNLQPIELIAENLHVGDDILKSLLVKRDALEVDDQGSTVRCVTRSGHVLNGHLWDFDKYCLYMHVNKKTVIVYRDGILKFRNITWDEISKAYKNGTTINGHIIARVPRGFTVRYQLLDGFLPESEVTLQMSQNLDSYVGKTLEMKVIQISASHNRIVFSHRAWLEELRTQFFNTLEIGQTVMGTVKNIKDFGAFVDLDGVDGLIHKSEMAWKRINHPSEIVSIGEDVRVKVIAFNRENRKISLSLRQLTSDPWENIEEKYPIGTTVSGVVVNVVNYGAFVQLEEGVEGLIHISQLANRRIEMPTEIVTTGEELEVKVISISPEVRRIGLSLKALVTERHHSSVAREKRRINPSGKDRALPQRKLERRKRESEKTAIGLALQKAGVKSSSDDFEK